MVIGTFCKQTMVLGDSSDFPFAGAKNVGLCRLSFVIPLKKSVIVRLPQRLGSSLRKHKFAPSCLRSFSILENTDENFDGDDKLNSNIVDADRMLVLGMGYVGRWFGKKIASKGWSVCGTCTTVEKRLQLEKQGLNSYVLNAENAIESSVFDTIKEYSHILVSIPPIAGIGDPLLRNRALLRENLAGGCLKWLCYLSSTSVYGDAKGGLVDEHDELQATSEGSKMRIAAEKGWVDFGESMGIRCGVLRLGGIYGPGRSAVDTLLNRKPLSESQTKRSSKKYTSRIHVNDVCEALEASILSPCFRGIYNVVDDDPAPREHVFAFADHLIRTTRPDLVRKLPPFSTAVDNCLSDGKRVSNARIKSQLGLKLMYPSYKTGFLQVLHHYHCPSL